MSRETMEALNRNFLVGFTEKRGRAWHYRADLQNEDTPNHFPGAIPLEVVEERLFSWDPLPVPVWTGTTKSGVRKDESMIAVERSDTGDRLGYFTAGYKIHHPKEWLLKNVATLLDSDLEIGGAGLPRNGGAAYVQVEMPENVTTKEGVVIRPHLLAGTSMDGTQATFYKPVATVVVCDNTYAIAQAEKGDVLRVKHTSLSLPRLASAREALGLVFKSGEAFAAEVDALIGVKVSEKDWQRFVKAYVLDGITGTPTTFATNKIDALKGLYDNDMRVAPWAGTAWGVVQAVNTHRHHIGTVRNVSRVERNAINAMTNKGAQDDMKARAILADILS